MNRMALFSLAAFAIDTVVFDLLPNGVSAVLSNKRAERISRQQTFAQMALRSALGALWFRSLDKDASGFIEREELRKLLEDLGYKLPDDRAFEEIFRALDLSQDGKIDVFEFAAWWTEVSELVKALTEAAEARDPIALREALRPSWAVEPPLDHEDVDTAISHGHTHVLSASLSLSCRPGDTKFWNNHRGTYR